MLEQKMVIVAVGMDKMTPMEFLATGLKLQGGTMSALVIASQALRKGGTIKILVFMEVGITTFPVGDIFQRNLNICTGQAPVIHYLPFL